MPGTPHPSLTRAGPGCRSAGAIASWAFSRDMFITSNSVCPKRSQTLPLLTPAPRRPPEPEARERPPKPPPAPRRSGHEAHPLLPPALRSDRNRPHHCPSEPPAHALGVRGGPWSGHADAVPSCAGSEGGLPAHAPEGRAGDEAADRPPGAPWLPREPRSRRGRCRSPHEDVREDAETRGQCHVDRGRAPASMRPFLTGGGVPGLVRGRRGRGRGENRAGLENSSAQRVAPE